MDTMINGYPAFLFIVFGGIGLIGVFSLMIGFFGFVITLPIVLFVLRKRKYYLIDKLDTYAPKKLQGWASSYSSFNMSWITSSQGALSWFSYPVNRWVDKLTGEEINNWKVGIKKELGKDYFIYWLNAQLSNVSLLGVIIMFVFVSIEYNYSILGVYA